MDPYTILQTANTLVSNPALVKVAEWTGSYLVRSVTSKTKPKPTNPFKQYYTSAGKRYMMSQDLRARHPGRVPVVIYPKEGERHPSLANEIKKRYLVDKDKTFGFFVTQIRRSLKLQEGQGLVFFVGKNIPVMSQTMAEIDKQYADSDGFVYVTFMLEHTFG